MTGTKESRVSKGDIVKVTYYRHVELIDIPDAVKILLNCNLTINKIIFDPENSLWKIIYFEYL